MYRSEWPTIHLLSTLCLITWVKSKTGGISSLFASSTRWNRLALLKNKYWPQMRRWRAQAAPVKTCLCLFVTLLTDIKSLVELWIGHVLAWPRHLGWLFQIPNLTEDAFVSLFELYAHRGCLDAWWNKVRDWTGWAWFCAYKRLDQSRFYCFAKSVALNRTMNRLSRCCCVQTS